MADKKDKKEEVLTLIKEQLNDLIVVDRIPQRKGFDNEKNKEIAKKINNTIVSQFIVDEIIVDLTLDEVLKKTKKDDSSLVGRKKFSSIKNIDIPSIATEVFSKLDNLPEEYTFIFRLPKTNKSFSKISLGTDIELVSLDESNIKDYKYTNPSDISSLSALAFSLKNPIRKLVIGDTLLFVKGRGYIDKYAIIKIVSIIDPLYIFKVIIGIYKSNGILGENSDKEYLSPYSGYSYHIYNSKNEEVRKINESSEDDHLIDSLKFNDSVFKLTEMDSLIEKPFSKFDHVNTCIKNLFTKIKFGKGKTDKEVIRKKTRIKNGAYWYYEALKTEKNHIRAINIITGYDSLLNLKGENDTKEYKAIMVSNLISGNELRADAIREQITKLYVLRNKIIHGETAISSLEKYNYEFNKSLGLLVYQNIKFLSQLLSNRMVFLNKGLAIILKVIRQ